MPPAIGRLDMKLLTGPEEQDKVACSWGESILITRCCAATGYEVTVFNLEILPHGAPNETSSSLAIRTSL